MEKIKKFIKEKKELSFLLKILKSDSKKNNPSKGKELNFKKLNNKDLKELLKKFLEKSKNKKEAKEEVPELEAQTSFMKFWSEFLDEDSKILLKPDKKKRRSSGTPNFIFQQEKEDKNISYNVFNPEKELYQESKIIQGEEENKIKEIEVSLGYTFSKKEREDYLNSNPLLKAKIEKKKNLENYSIIKNLELKEKPKIDFPFETKEKDKKLYKEFSV